MPRNTIRKKFVSVSTLTLKNLAVFPATFAAAFVTSGPVGSFCGRNLFHPSCEACCCSRSTAFGSRSASCENCSTAFGPTSHPPRASRPSSDSNTITSAHTRGRRVSRLTFAESILRKTASKIPAKTASQPDTRHQQTHRQQQAHRREQPLHIARFRVLRACRGVPQIHSRGTAW